MDGKFAAEAVNKIRYPKIAGIGAIHGIKASFVSLFEEFKIMITARSMHDIAIITYAKTDNSI